MDGFRKVVEECDLEDLTKDINTFTWCNGQKANFMLEKLDKCLANLDWVNLFPNLRAFHLEWWCSDHKALVLDTEIEEEEECGDIVRDGLNSLDPCSSDWEYKELGITKRRRNWNTKKKKELHYRVKEGMKRVDDLPKSMNAVGSGENIDVTKDKWLPRLLSFKPIISPEIPIGTKVIDLRLANGDWDVEFIKTIFCGADVELILRIQQGSLETKDKLIWHFAKNGEYNIRKILVALG
ncbi:hypothetical protein F8388_002004 [Cannabis sativa]|uniref:Uncharacterized protein n=1 Tax=Cannabis sativa TaxID=3483 RepID=A0A7J6HTN6_CANSA|nr:hypothetical protein F8388_002004 [Cannabis sativa]KAF4398647.1 hypothetical protein G4B88_013736 [Cannabis sativa]